MRILAEPFLKAAAKRHPQAAEWLAVWRNTVRAARWRNLMELRTTYPQADSVTVRSGRTVTVFNAGGNKFRLIAAIHFKTQTVFALRFLTHAEYSKDRWKGEL